MDMQDKVRELDIHLDAHPYKHRVAINGLPFRLAESIEVDANVDDMTKITFTCFVEKQAGLEVSGIMEGKYQLGDNKPEVLRQQVRILFEDVAALTQVYLDDKRVPRLTHVSASAKAGEGTTIELAGVEFDGNTGRPIEWTYSGLLVETNPA